MELPPYSESTLSTTPPFRFERVMTVVFPLRAKQESLQRFCDDYLNLIPPQLGYFRASIPYVHLMLLDYGKLAAPATNFGWFSQRELLFSIPLEWYKWVGGRWVFYDWASVTPFVYVDECTSMTIGRTLMGWPKSMVKLQPALTGWMKDPDGSKVELALSARRLGSTPAEAKTELPMLEIHGPSRTNVRLPFDATSPLEPWNAWMVAAKGMAALTLEAMTWARELAWIKPQEGSNLENNVRRAAKLAGLGAQWLPWSAPFAANSVNLKQFRLADDPERYAYQAVTNGPIAITAFNRGGSLGNAVGGASAGYTISLASWPSLPIVDTLGLEAEHVRSPSGPSQALLRPVFPFWYDVDMAYAKTETLAWRWHREARWADATGKRYELSRNGEDSDQQRSFNTTTGAASPVRAGPFHLPCATLTVMPLLASKRKLNALLKRVLNDPLSTTHEQFAVWSEDDQAYDLAYAYLVILEGGEIASRTNNVGSWGDQTVMFCVPVERRCKDQVVGRGLYPAFTFAEDTTDVCTLSELYGISAVQAQFVKRAHAWDAIQPVAPRTFLEMSVESLPSLHEGSRAESGTLLEFADRGLGPTLDSVPLSKDAADFCRRLKEELGRKNGYSAEEMTAGRLQALKLLAFGAPLRLYTMKQFRDAGQPGNACYQSLVEVHVTVQELLQLHELERLLAVRMHERATFPLAHTLGLIPREVKVEQGSLVRGFEPVRPFRLRASLDLHDGSELYSRVDVHWRMNHRVQLAHEGSSPQTPHDGRLHELDGALTLRGSGSLRQDVERWLEEEKVTWRDVKSAIRSFSGPPQPVIESLLSRSWNDASGTSRIAVAREQLRFARQQSNLTWTDAEIDEAAESMRKPDHCIMRATAGSEREHLFPGSESQDAFWYGKRTRAEAVATRRGSAPTSG